MNRCLVEVEGFSSQMKVETASFKWILSFVVKLQIDLCHEDQNLFTDLCFSYFEFKDNQVQYFDHILECLDTIFFPFPLIMIPDKAVPRLTGFQGLVSLLAPEWVKFPWYKRIMHMCHSSKFLSLRESPR